ncbi:MAG: arginine--tRNA ligase [Acutalibacteraceae bacterium]|nr:arginine--tRNA ligase [Acutalibacteraceae bacterium]
MANIIKQSIDTLKIAINNAIEKAKETGALINAETPDFIIEIPADKKNGDLATNAAMVCARAFKTSPRNIAQAITDNLSLENTYIERFEIAGPGFINFFLNSNYYSDVVKAVIEEKDDYGKSDFGKGKRILVEFVSANPTGPMHIGNARGGALGDCLASVLQTAGYDVQREFYVNDAGNQIEKFKTSLEVRYLQIYDNTVEMPEDAYQGADITAHANAFNEKYGDKYLNVSSEERKQALCDFALPINIANLKKDLAKYRIEYDNWFLESSLHNGGAVADIIEKLKESGHTYEQEGALWFKTTDFGDDKDRVLLRANGVPTYLVPDIAYHYNKLVTRGYDTAIDILGADHHGYIPRIKASMAALGVNPDNLDIIIMQMVRLMKDGEVYKLSKRSGKAITLSTLIEEVSVDAARFLFNTREANTQMDFDIDLAIKQDSQNPVYYVQYAHARICSIIKALENDGITARECSYDELALLNTIEEKELITHIANYTNEIISAASDYDATKVTRYVLQLAALFHKFYNSCRVKGDNESLTQARLNLCIAVKTVIKNVLTMLKITAPESM